MNRFQPTSEIGKRGTGIPNPVEWSDLSGPLTTVLDALVPFGFIILGLPSPSSPDSHPLDAAAGDLLPYLQIHRRPTGVLVLEFSSNHFLRPPHQLHSETEFALVEHGWSIPRPASLSRANFHRLCTDGFGATNVIIETMQILGLEPAQVALLDCAVAQQTEPGGIPVPELPDTTMLEELFDEAAAARQAVVSQTHVPEGHVSSSGSLGDPAAALDRDYYAASLAAAGYRITLHAGDPGFEVETERGPISVRCDGRDVVLTVVLAEPSEEVQKRSLAAILLAINKSTLESHAGTAFALDELVVVRRRIRGLQPEELVPEIQDFVCEVHRFEGRLIALLAELDGENP